MKKIGFVGVEENVRVVQTDVEYIHKIQKKIDVKLCYFIIDCSLLLGDVCSGEYTLKVTFYIANIVNRQGYL